MIPFKAVIGFLFFLLIAMVSVLGLVCYERNKEVLKRSVLVEQSHRLIQFSNDISFAYRDILLSSDPSVRSRDAGAWQRYNQAKHALLAGVQEMRDLTRGDRLLQKGIDSLELTAIHWISRLDQVVAGIMQAQSPLETYYRGTHAVEILTLRREIDGMEQRLLQTHFTDHGQAAVTFQRTFLLLLAGMTVLIVSTFLAVRYHFNKRARMQLEMRKANALFEKVFYDSPIPMLISELETGRILKANKVFMDAVNYRTEDVVGRAASELGIFAHQDERGGKGSTVDNGQARHTEAYIQPAGRDPIYVSIHEMVVPVYDGKCLLTAMLDLTAHKKAQDEVRKALEAEVELNRLKTNFVALASHEFRTPLTTILSSAFLLEKYFIGENQEKAAKHLARTKAAVGNLTFILDEFLSVAKIEQGQMRPNLEKTDLPQCVARVCRDLEAFAKPGQTIHYSHSGEHEVNTDPVLLANILKNIVTNSIKYSPENSPIFVSSSVNSRIHVTVRDRGIGIPEADRKHLFERFYRASNAGTVQGTGMGLHIMKHYVQMLHGSVTLESEEGKGTEVNVTFDNIA